MAKLLLGSVLFVPLLIALRAASLRDPRRGIRQTVVQSLGFLAFWVLSVVYLYFRLPQ
jgi:hypothetical protein